MGNALKTFVAVSVFTLLSGSISQAGPDYKTIDTAQLHSLVVDNAYRLEGGRPQSFTIVDARTEEEYDEAHIFSAISIPIRDFEKLINRLPKDKGTLLVVYDNDAKRGTSGTWAETAAAAGYTNIVLYSEGFPAWKKSKMPVAPTESGKR
jgi:rhodanese-related sulfurtransferase